MVSNCLPKINMLKSYSSVPQNRDIAYVIGKDEVLLEWAPKSV